MRKLLAVCVVAASALALSGCYASKKSSEYELDPNKRLYIEEGEFMSEAEANAQRERRGAKPVVESNYIFRVLPQDTYFYDEKNMPIEGNVKKASDYKEKRLWTRPKRFAPGEYGTGGGGASTPEPAAPSYDSYDDGYYGFE
ncbi:hypothetical protein Dip518_001329 [Parelusimicrobium proximum]|uniref:hypothetical protein n=1 Tax=Parelusimicrobium proximum TaxID=3228953 RepID=UPI003D168717